jgi:hypothetical protein
MAKKKFNVKGKDALNLIKKIIKKGNVSRLVIKNGEGKVIFNMPITLVALGTILAPIIAGAGAVLALVKECSIEVDTKEED